MSGPTILRYQVLAPRRYCVGRTPTGQPEFFTATPAHIRHLHDVGRRMLSAGVPVPACWEHRTDAMPGKKNSRDDAVSMRAKGTAGFVSDYEIDSNNVLWAKVQIDDAEEAKAAQRVKFCSPYIPESVLDGDGTDWGPAIAHLALTPKPRNHRQPPATVALSMVADPKALFRGTLWFAVDSEKGSDMPDDDKPAKPDGTATSDDPGNKPPAAADTPPGPPNAQVDQPPKPPSEEEVAFKAALATLAEAGYVLGADTTKDNLLERLVVAINTKKAVETNSVPDEDDLPPGGGPAYEEMPGAGITGTPVLMSRLEEYERKSLSRRLDNLLRSGRCKPAEHKAHKEKLLAKDAAKGIKLSFDDQGQPKPNEVSDFLKVREPMPRGSIFPLSGKDNQTAISLSRADVTEVSPPDPAGKEAEEMKALAKKEAERVSVKRK